jgi:hypothetical protein
VHSAVHLPEARVLSKAYTEWQETTSPIRTRRRQYESWINSIPTNIEDVWFSPDKPPSLWGSDSGGLREALLVLGAAAELDVPSLREAMVEKYLSLHPDQVLTEAEQTLLDATPPGADTVLVSLTGLLVEKVKQTLLPQF